LNRVDKSLGVSLLTSETMPDLADYITIQDAAKKLGYHVESVRRMLRDKVLDGVKWGKSWFVLRE
jgi:excisionase family DNA binding protein